MGALVYGVRYTLPEYMCTILIAGGVSVFALFKVHSSKSFCRPIDLVVIGSSECGRYMMQVHLMHYESFLFKSERGNNMVFKTISMNRKHDELCHCTTVRGRMYLEMVLPLQFY